MYYKLTPEQAATITIALLALKGSEPLKNVCQISDKDINSAKTAITGGGVVGIPVEPILFIKEDR